MAVETNEILGHGAEADGIEEYDNPLPDWWLGLFVLTIIWAAGYWGYWTFTDISQESLYNEEMAAAAIAYPSSETPSELSTDPAVIAEGEQLFQQTCASCHNAALTGGIGPNLIDSEWIHGGDSASILATITDGVAAKGMPAWGPILGPKKVQAVAAFVVSKQGSAPEAAPKEAAPVEEAPVADGTPEEPLDPIAAGEAVYKANCLACHGPELKGLVGPDLTDDEWIHGGDLDSIRKTITEGVPAKGMVSWGPILGDEKIDQVARFVQSKGTQPEAP